MPAVMVAPVSDDELRRILARGMWRLWALPDGGHAQSTLVDGERDTRAEWRRLVRSIDATSQARHLPRDVLAWSGYRARVVDVTCWLRPVASDDRLSVSAAAAVREYVLDVARAGMSRLSG